MEEEEAESHLTGGLIVHTSPSQVTTDIHTLTAAQEVEGGTVRIRGLYTQEPREAPQVLDTRILTSCKRRSTTNTHGVFKQTRCVTIYIIYPFIENLPREEERGLSDILHRAAQQVQA